MEEWPLTPNAPGGAGPLCYSHLELLAHAGLEITLVVLVDYQSSKGFKEFTEKQSDTWEKVQAWCSNTHLVSLERDKRRLSIFSQLWYAWRHPELLFFLAGNKLIKQIHELVSATNPTVIWTEHLLPTTLISQALSGKNVVYSHHDWHSRVKAHRQQRNQLPYKVKMWIRRRHEVNLVKEVNACVAASATEAVEIEKVSGRPVGYFPTTYQRLIDNVATLPNCPRVVHLGGMQTTANRLGLERFLDVSWPLICQSLAEPPELWVVGSINGAPSSLLAKLKETNAICTGFVEDLMTVLRPYDIHIIPWEYNTGTRTRIPLILNHRQVLLSTRAAAACLSELSHEQNCILVEDLTQMASEVINLVNNPHQRRQLAWTGRETFEKHYTREAIQPRFNKFLQNLIADG